MSARILLLSALCCLLSGVISAAYDEFAIVKALQGDVPGSLLAAPYRENETVNVQIFPVIAKLIDVNEVDEYLVLQLRLYVSWSDYRLTWNSSEFGGMEFVNIHATDIWTPDMSLYNTAKIFDDNEITPASNFVHVSSDGSCVWEPRFERSESHCSLDVTWFPFDVQSCILNYQSFRYDASIVVLQTVSGPDKVDLSYLSQNDLWDIERADGEARIVHGTQRNFSRVTFTFDLHRKPLYYVVNLLIPFYFLAFLTLVSSLLQPFCGDRLGLTVTLYLTMSVYQLAVAENLPVSSNNVPIIGIFFLFVNAVCVCTVTTTVIVLYIYIRCETPFVPAMKPWLKELLCVKLASWVRIKPHHDVTPTSTEMYKRRNSGGGDGINGNTAFDSDHNVMTTDLRPFERQVLSLLTSMKQLQEACARRDSERVQTADQLEDRKKDWTLAAAVLDRIFFIFYVLLFVVSTVAFASVSSLANRL